MIIPLRSIFLVAAVVLSPLAGLGNLCSDAWSNVPDREAYVDLFRAVGEIHVSRLEEAYRQFRAGRLSAFDFGKLTEVDGRYFIDTFYRHYGRRTSYFLERTGEGWHVSTGNAFLLGKVKRGSIFRGMSEAEYGVRRFVQEIWAGKAPDTAGITRAIALIKEFGRDWNVGELEKIIASVGGSRGQSRMEIRSQLVKIISLIPHGYGGPFFTPEKSRAERRAREAFRGGPVAEFSTGVLEDGPNLYLGIDMGFIEVAVFSPEIDFDLTLSMKLLP